MFCTPEVEEECEEVVGNLNGILYVVAVKTDVKIIVGNLLRQISTVLFFCVGVVQLCARSQAAGERQQIGQKEA